MFAINKESKKVYRIVDVDDVVQLERVGDGFAVQLSQPSFVVKYRPATPQELSVLDRRLPEFERIGRPITVEQLSESEQEGEQQQEESKVGSIATPDHRHDFDRIIIDSAVKKSIDIGLHKIAAKDFLNDEWNMKSVEPMGGKCAMNFYGPPGTGKTLSAMAVAKQLGKKLLQVDYSQIISKWVGDTGKHIAEAFADAKKHDAILFFDEADSMLSKRVSSESASESPSINQNRNILMQELDKFDGVVIFTTNLFSNYDEALLRRIAQHVEFTLPNKDMRARLIQQHIPAEVPRRDIDVDKLADETADFSGGDIKNVCINAIIAASMEQERILTMDLLLSECKKVREAKKSHGGKGGGKKHKTLGFHAAWGNT